MGEMEAITSSGTRMTRTSPGTSTATPSDKITVCRPGAYFTASCRSFVPSDTNSPASSLAFREDRSFFTCCRKGFFREVILSSIVHNSPSFGHT